MPFRFYAFSLLISGNADPYVANLYGCVLALDRHKARKDGKAGALLSLDAKTLSLLPLDYVGFVVERSVDGLVWADVSGLVENVHFYVDIPPSEGIYFYRARAKNALGDFYAYGNTVQLDVSRWGDADSLGVSEIEANAGTLVDRISPTSPYPQGFGGLQHEGVSLQEGSLCGGFSDGVWLSATKEQEPPYYQAISPLCGATGVLLPLSSIRFDLHDLPNPNGSGINDSTLVIELSVSSQSGGAFLEVYNGGVEPFSPSITTGVIAGFDPILDREIEVFLPVGYVVQGDVVQVRVQVYDNDGNRLEHLCSFTMQSLDVTPPTIEAVSPLCGDGINAGTVRVRRDASIFFEVRDDVAVDLTTLQVYLGPTSSGPWTQVIQSGATFLLGFTGLITPNGSGYDVTLIRPASDPLWTADATYYYRVTVSDSSANASEKICGFRVVDSTYLEKVIPISETLVLLLFSSALSQDDPRNVDPQSYTIQAQQSGQKDVFVKESLRQGFAGNQAQSSVLSNPTNVPLAERFGGNPRAFLLLTTPHRFLEKYLLQVSPLLRDEYGVPIDSTRTSYLYRGRRTKADEVRDNMKDTTATQRDSVTRTILLAMGYVDEQIGGVFLPDDWEN